MFSKCVTVVCSPETRYKFILTLKHPAQYISRLHLKKRKIIRNIYLYHSLCKEISQYVLSDFLGLEY